MRKSWIIRGGVRASQKVGAVCIEARRHENANRVAGRLVRLQPGALEASGDKLGDMDREQAWCSSFQSHHLQLEGSSYKVMPILVLLLQISHGPHGLGVKAHTSKSAFKTLPNLTTAYLSQLVSQRPTWRGKSRGFFQALASFCAGPSST